MEEKSREKIQTENRKRTAGGGMFFRGVLFGILLTLLFVLALLFGSRLIRNLGGNGNPGARVLTSSSTRAKLAEVEDLIENAYLEEVDGQEMQDYIFRGVAAGLDDPYASYYTEEELSAVLDSSRGEYYGIGASIGVDPESGAFTIAEVYEGFPAEEGGLREGDCVLAINGDSVEDLTLSELTTLIREQETFTMTVFRPDSASEVELTITCGDVEQDYVSWEMLENGIGCLQLTQFTESAVEQFREAIADLQEQGMEALIVDLRDNPGGLLTSVCDILDLILPEGELIVYTEDKSGNRADYNAAEEQSVTCPVAVLVNGESASASEIFAGAVQDYEIGPVIGTKTYGKGVVQKTFSLSDGSAFKMTVENYYTPKGQEIDGNGIVPDITVEEEKKDAGETEEDPVLERALLELGG